MKLPIWTLPLLMCAALMSSESRAEGAGIRVDYAAPAPKDNYAVASFRAWCPPVEGNLQGVLVLVPGSNGDGRPRADEPVWRHFAAEHRLALVACFFKDNQELLDEFYAQASHGSGQALLDAIDIFAKALHHPELSQAPLLLWGCSAGGQFNYEFASWKPSRVMAFIVNKGGFYHTIPTPKEMLRVPAMLFLGENDLQRRIDAVSNLFIQGRSRGALWSLAVDPGAGHDCASTEVPSRVFLHAVLTAPRKGADFAEPWESNQVSRALRPAKPGQHDSGSNWFPDKATAEAWKAFETR